MIDRQGPYAIKFIGLKTGNHSFHFELDKKFFEHFDYSEIEDSSIQVDILLEKGNNMMIFNIDLSGTVAGLCDRCQDPIELNIAHQDRLIVKFGDQTGDTSDEILVLGPNEFQIDLSQFLYEYSHLALPGKRVHADEKDCNQEVLDFLDGIIEQDNEDDQPSDPRWDQLKNLKK